jgi:quercetin dioxygenase-like cupin family protein
MVSKHYGMIIAGGSRCRVKVQGCQEFSKVKHPVLSGVETCSLRNLKDKVLEDLSLRVFEIQPGAENPLHAHVYSHDLFVIRDTGLVQLENGM